MVTEALYSCLDAFITKTRHRTSPGKRIIETVALLR